MRHRSSSPIRDDLPAFSPILTNTLNTTRDHWTGYRPHRKLLVVHIGKAGGSTFRQRTALVCYARHNTTQDIAHCVDERYPDPTNTTTTNTNTTHQHQHVVARQTHFVTHVQEFRPNDLEHATSLVFMLRNPIERITSTFRYSHPQNCHPQTRAYGPRACHNWDWMYDNSSTVNVSVYHDVLHLLYTDCFPTADMESFAQRLLTPYPFNTTSSSSSSSNHHHHHICQWNALRMVQGHYDAVVPAPHMYYNYHYYANLTQALHPHQTKELFGIRTTDQWHDMVHLEQQLGGRTVLVDNDHRNISHGSEYFVPTARLTHLARHKLCCVLHHEIQVYFQLLDHMWNLDDAQKDDEQRRVHQTCHMTSESFVAWKQHCRKWVQRDQRALVQEIQRNQQPKQPQQLTA